MISTIQLNEEVKKELNRMKTENQTYEEVILGLIKISEQCKRNKEQLLIEGCEIMGKESLRIAREFESIENLDKWEW